jgi:uracil-DNA glycosylase
MIQGRTKMFLKNLLPAPWKPYLQSVLESPEFESLSRFVEAEQNTPAGILPFPDQIFSALRHVEPGSIRAVILGQDPYHDENQATGMSFAVPNSMKTKPPSLRNILKELASDLGIHPDPKESDLTGWADQGVLLLNSVLTVRPHSPLSHQKQGWEEFTDTILSIANSEAAPSVFVLWGAHARKKAPLIDRRKHRILESAHPSPLSAYRGFFGSKPFSEINRELALFGRTPIDWSRISRIKGL